MASILVVDDDEKVRTLVRGLLETEGHQVREAGDGVQGMHAFIHERPDLVVCDLFMPEQGGLKTIREMRLRDPAVPIIAMSGGASWDSSSAHLFLTAAQGFGTVSELAKPFTIDALLSAVRRALKPPRKTPAPSATKD